MPPQLSGPPGPQGIPTRLTISTRSPNFLLTACRSQPSHFWMRQRAMSASSRFEPQSRVLRKEVGVPLKKLTFILLPAKLHHSTLLRSNTAPHRSKLLNELREKSTLRKRQSHITTFSRLRPCRVKSDSAMFQISML